MAAADCSPARLQQHYAQKTLARGSGTAYAPVEHTAFDEHAHWRGHDGDEEDGETVEPAVDVLFSLFQHLADGLLGESLRSVEHTDVDRQAFEGFGKPEEIGGDPAGACHGHAHTAVAHLVVEGTREDADVGLRGRVHGYPGHRHPA